MSHHCHWPGCSEEVPPAMWGCRAHWFRLPPSIRQWIWRTYVPGQEITKTPSKAYIEAATAAQNWIKNLSDVKAPEVKKRAVKPKPICKRCGKPLYKTSREYWTCWDGECRGLISSEAIKCEQRILYRTKGGSPVPTLKDAYKLGIDRESLVRIKEFLI